MQKVNGVSVALIWCVGKVVMHSWTTDKTKSSAILGNWIAVALFFTVLIHELKFDKMIEVATGAGQFCLQYHVGWRGRLGVGESVKCLAGSPA